MSVERDPIFVLQERVANLAKEIQKLRNQSAPTVPIYDQDQFPIDVVEGQIALANDGNAYKFQNGAWSQIGGGGIDFNKDNEGGWLTVVANDWNHDTPVGKAGIYLQDKSGAGVNLDGTDAGGGITLQTDWTGTPLFGDGGINIGTNNGVNVISGLFALSATSTVNITANGTIQIGNSAGTTPATLLLGSGISGGCAVSLGPTSSFGVQDGAVTGVELFRIDPDGHIHGKSSIGAITWDL